ncbi:MAG: hypothetical protein BKP49_10230 [Treponema sp. CETP13]|nr:MAG: hypothetical protein BKP49_10230 [Treponema sp. CETP13]
MNLNLAVTAALGALTVLLAITHLGYIPWFSGASITVLHVPVILACIMLGFSSGVTTGLIFGLTSLIMAATMPTGPIDPFFVNPLISVLPRLLFAASTWTIYRGFASISNKIKYFPNLLAIGLAAFLGTVLHSVFVLGSLVIAHAIDWKVFFAVLVGNSLLEAAAATVITVSVVSIKDVSSANKKSKLSREDD